MKDIANPSDEMITFLHAVRDSISETQKQGLHPHSIVISPRCHEIVTGEPKHRQYDPEQQYGQAYGLPIYVDDSLQGFVAYLKTSYY